MANEKFPTAPNQNQALSNPRRDVADNARSPDDRTRNPVGSAHNPQYPNQQRGSGDAYGNQKMVDGGSYEDDGALGRRRNPDGSMANEMSPKAKAAMDRVEVALAKQPYRGVPSFADLRAVARAIIEHGADEPMTERMAVDPATGGYVVDPATGRHVVVDASTGRPVAHHVPRRSVVDPVTGQPLAGPTFAGLAVNQDRADGRFTDGRAMDDPSTGRRMATDPVAGQVVDPATGRAVDGRPAAGRTVDGRTVMDGTTGRAMPNDPAQSRVRPVTDGGGPTIAQATLGQPLASRSEQAWDGRSADPAARRDGPVAGRPAVDPDTGRTVDGRPGDGRLGTDPVTGRRHVVTDPETGRPVVDAATGRPAMDPATGRPADRRPVDGRVADGRPVSGQAEGWPADGRNVTGAADPNRAPMPDATRSPAPRADLGPTPPPRRPIR